MGESLGKENEGKVWEEKRNTGKEIEKMKGIMKGKKAWIRIAEAAIAIMLLASVILVIVGRQAEKQDIGEVMYKIQHNILDEASRNDTVRNAVLLGNSQQINLFIRERLPAGMNFTTKICSPAELCETELPGNEVYVDDVIISSTLQQYQPKKLKFYAWIE